MPSPGKSRAAAGSPARRASLAVRFGLVFALAVLLLTVGLTLGRALYVGLAGDAELVNDTGLLRSLSQQMAVRAIDAENGDGDAVALLQSLGGIFTRRLERISVRIDDTPWIVIAGETEVRAAHRRLIDEWHDYRHTVVLRMHPEDRDVRRNIFEHTARLHAAADMLTQQVLNTSRASHRLLDGLTALAILGNMLLLAHVFRLLHRRVLAPVDALATAARAFTRNGGSLDDQTPDQFRVDPAGDDEIGDLARACAESAAHVHLLLEEQRRFQRIVERTTDLIALILPDGRSVFINPAGRRMLGIEENDAIFGRRLIERQLLERLGAEASEDGTWQGETRLAKSDGSTLPVSLVAVPHHKSGNTAGLSLIARDSSEREAYEARLLHQASHDALTGLPNVALLRDRLEQSLTFAQRHERGLAVAYLDLDHFKHVNDSLGHDCGDALLRDIAQRLADCLRDGDTVARQGGDEFVILLADLAEEAQIAGIVHKLLAALTEPVAVAGRELYVTGSIGISVYPRDGGDAETLLKNADTALYRAKELGRNNFQFYTAQMNALTLERMEIESQLRHALAGGEFSLHYQPQIDLYSGELIGLEALLRWNNPQLGAVPPARFIPLAEEIGLITEIGAWVLREACAQGAAWQRAGLPCRRLAVNVSSRQFARHDLATQVAAALADSGLEARCLELELTESLLMADADASIAQLRELKALGVSITIDDFGTGYSSLAYLKRFPIDSLKIDQSFVRDIITDPDDAAIARTVISMAHDLQLTVVAEGVETVEQLAFLRDRRCDSVQGYYFSRPVPAEEIARLLARDEPFIAGSGARQHEARTLLLVDDEPYVLEALQRQLRREDYRILHATSGRDALHLLVDHRVGVIVTDYHMPGMNGVELLRRARELSPDTVRIMLTGAADLDNVRAAINTGAVYKHFTKPWDDNELRLALREAFWRYELVQPPQPAGLV